MRDILQRIQRSTWRNCLILAPVIIAFWFILGWVLSLSYFDTDLFESYKVINLKESALSYVALLFAVQIPIFILLLERMVAAGYIRRLILPGVIKFRELLVSYVLLSLLLLIAPRASYYYFPVIALTLLSLYTIFESVRVMFEQRKLRKRENYFVEKTVNGVMKESLYHRINSNTFLEEVKKLERVTYTLLDIGSHYENTESLEIRSKKEGLVKSIETTQLEDLMVQHFSTVGSEDKELQSNNDTLIKLVLSVRPGSTVKAQERLMKLIVPTDRNTPGGRFINKLRKAVKIETEAVDSENKKLEDLTTAFRQQLRDAVDKDSVVALEQSLEFYQLLLSGFTSFSKEVSGSEYSFTNARQEFHQFMGDSVSRQITAISDILNNELQHAIRDEKRETSRTIIGFIYGQLLNVVHEDDVLRAAFADYALVFALDRLISKEYSNNMPSSFSNEIFKYIAFRLKEHTDLLLYNYRNEEGDSKLPKVQLEEWLESRINDTRGFLLAAYKRSNFTYFKELLGVFNEFEKDYRFYKQDVEKLTQRTRCNLLLIAAYINQNADENEAQKLCHQEIRELMSNLSPADLTRTLVECIDSNYSDKWRFDTVDIPADGTMHEVPNYNDLLRMAWVDLMLAKPNFPANVDRYESTPLGTTLAFSNGATEVKDTFLIKHIDTLNEDSLAKAKLKRLIEAFITKRKEWEDDTLATVPLDNGKVKKFRESVINGYKDRAIVVKIFNKARKVKSVQKTDKKFVMLGWNRIREKAAFAILENWHIGYGLEGKDRGAEIAGKQNELIVASLLSGATKVDSIDEWLTKITNTKDRWAIFHVDVNSWYVRTHFEKYLQESRQYDDIYFKDVKQLTKSEHIYHNSLPNGLYAVRARHLGVVSVELADRQYIEVAIDAYSHDSKLLSSILSKPPAWLKKKGSKQEQERFLKTMVRMYLYHTYKYSPYHEAEVYYFPIKDDLY